MKSAAPHAHETWKKGELTGLLSILLKQPQLETLVEFQLPHVPELLQVLPRPMQLIQQSRNFSH